MRLFQGSTYEWFCFRFLSYLRETSLSDVSFSLITRLKRCAVVVLPFLCYHCYHCVTGTLIEAPCTLVNSVRVLRCSARSLCERVCVPDLQPGATGVSCNSDGGNKTACALCFATLGCSAKWLHLLPSRIFLFFFLTLL